MTLEEEDDARTGEGYHKFFTAFSKPTNQTSPATEPKKENPMKHWLHKLINKPEKKASATAPLFVTGGAHQPLWTPRQYDTLAEEGYQKNMVVYRCVSLIARGVGSVPWRLYKGGKRVETHPLFTLIQNPNPQQGLARFMEGLTAYLLLAGNVYIEAVIPLGEPLELYLLRPDRVMVVPGHQERRKLFEYTLQGDPCVFLWIPSMGDLGFYTFKTFNPLNDWYGMSPIEAAAHSIDQHNAVSSHNLFLLQNGGRPSGPLNFARGIVKIFSQKNNGNVYTKN